MSPLAGVLAVDVGVALACCTVALGLWVVLMGSGELGAGPRNLRRGRWINGLLVGAAIATVLGVSLAIGAVVTGALPNGTGWLVFAGLAWVVALGVSLLLAKTYASRPARKPR